jgi:hypothetical protein
MSDTPNPGGPQAVGRGCTCPVYDNHRGKGFNGNFWITVDCPLHGAEGERG